ADMVPNPMARRVPACSHPATVVPEECPAGKTRTTLPCASRVSGLLGTITSSPGSEPEGLAADCEPAGDDRPDPSGADDRGGHGQGLLRSRAYVLEGQRAGDQSPAVSVVCPTSIKWPSGSRM